MPRYWTHSTNWKTTVSTRKTASGNKQYSTTLPKPLAESGPGEHYFMVRYHRELGILYWIKSNEEHWNTSVESRRD